MYFWRIEKLKAEMAARPLSDREVLPYLVVFVGLSPAVCYLPETIVDLWDGLDAVWSILLAVVGTIYIYSKNGGAIGQHFLQRYLALGWVVTIRWLAIVLFAGVAYVVTLIAFGVEAKVATWFDFMLLVLAEAVVYWRVGHHVGDLANRTKVT